MVDKDGLSPSPPKSPDGRSVNEEDREEMKKQLLAVAPSIRRSSSLKPFLDGGLAEAVKFSLAWSCFHLSSVLDRDSHFLKQEFPNLTYANILKRIPSGALIHVPSSTLRFGMYENLTREVETHNKGSPISLYQQLCCGLATGAVVASIATPIELVCARQRYQATFTDIYQNLYRTTRAHGILSLWRGASLVAHGKIAMNTGMLVSYDRCYSYFRGSLGSTENKAILGAGVVSSFFAVACYQPFMLVCQIKNSIELKDARRYQQVSSLDIAVKVVKQGGPFAFYRGFLNYFCRSSLAITGSWYLLESMRKLEYLEKRG